MRELLYNLGGRQFIAVMICGLGSFTLCITGHISGAEYVTVSLGLIGAYIAGDAYVSGKVATP